MRFASIFVAAALLALSQRNVVGAADLKSTSSQCTCTATYIGSGSSREVLCEGFDPATHQRCQCEKVPVGAQTACRARSAQGSPSHSQAVEDHHG